MSEQKNKCPDCENGFVTHYPNDREVQPYEDTCPTCNGTGEKKLARPNKRKQGRDVVADIYCAFRAYNEGEIDLEYWIAYLDDGLDQIIALITEAKIQEKTGILTIIKEIPCSYIANEVYRDTLLLAIEEEKSNE